jgi:uncharacterized protein YecE (DUF72 family)
MRGLGDKLGPLLLQFSYEFGPDRFDALARYLDELPPDLQYAVEIRNRDWYDTEICAMLAARGVALALHDLYYMPLREDVTANFVYIRWLGRRVDQQRFDSIQLDRRDEETWWAERVTRFLDRANRLRLINALGWHACRPRFRRLGHPPLIAQREGEGRGGREG